MFIKTIVWFQSIFIFFLNKTFQPFYKTSLFPTSSTSRVWKPTWSVCTTWWQSSSLPDVTNRRNTRNFSSLCASSTLCCWRGRSSSCWVGTLLTSSTMLISRWFVRYVDLLIYNIDYEFNDADFEVICSYVDLLIYNIDLLTVVVDVLLTLR